MLLKKFAKLTPILFSIAKLTGQTAPENKSQIPSLILAASLVFPFIASPNTYPLATIPVQTLVAHAISTRSVSLVGEKFSTSKSKTLGNPLTIATIFHKTRIGKGIKKLNVAMLCTPASPISFSLISSFYACLVSSLAKYLLLILA